MDRLNFTVWAALKIYMESFGGDVRIAEYIETLFIAPLRLREERNPEAF